LAHKVKKKPPKFYGPWETKPLGTKKIKKKFSRFSKRKSKTLPWRNNGLKSSRNSKAKKLELEYPLPQKK